MRPETKLQIQRVALFTAALLFTSAGVAHFVNPDFYVRIVPPYLPAALALVYVSGVCEILGGVGLLVRPTRRWAAYALIALLVAVFPANLHMATDSARFAAEVGVPEWTLFARLPVQLLLVAWMAWIAKPRPGEDPPEDG